jgi:hypothetical protein
MPVDPRLHYPSTPDGVEYFTEQYEIGLFTDDQYREALLALA